MTREYLNAEQLAALTPWNVEAIRRMVSRGRLRRGVHWFQPLGPRTQVLFKWSAIVALIEGDAAEGPPPAPQNGAGEGDADVAAATAALERLLD